VFDTGPDELDLDTLSLVSQMLGAAHGVNGRAAVLLRGAIVCGKIYFDLEKVLLDTGALHSSYISKDLVDRDAWRGKVIQCDGKVCLSDNKTEVNVTERVDKRCVTVFRSKPCDSHGRLLCVGHAWDGYDTWFARYLGSFFVCIGGCARDSTLTKAEHI
jgi:hypothetical protein